MRRKPVPGGVETIPVPALILDPEGRVTAANQLARTLLQTGAETLVGRPWESVQEEAIDRIPSSREELTVTGEPLPLGEDASLVILAPGTPLRREVYHLSRLACVGQHVSQVVHELNNALSGIVGYAQLTLERSRDDALSQDLRRIHDEALRTSRVVQNLLRFTRQGTGERAPVHVGELLERCAEMKRRQFVLKSIEFRLEVSRDLPAIEGDEALLFQVFLNLLTNAEQAIHAVRDHGRIHVAARRDNGAVRVDVRDDGPGIPADQRRRIFEPFFTTRAHSEGTGLGLTLCRDILQEHGAEIRLVRTRRPGTCFRLRFPIASRASGGPSTASPRRSPAQVRGCRIVVVEDEPAIREIVSRAFSGRGNRVVTFENGEDALGYLGAEPVDLVISDIHRPGLDGIQLYRAVGRQRPGLLSRFLFVSGDTVGEATAAFLERSGAAFLAKPILIADLQRAALEVLERSREQGELFRHA
jgi:signal transduction histidine kinase/ActR/RegA family two-component response regulator